MKKKVLKFVLAMSLCLSIGIGTLNGISGNQVHAKEMGRGIMDYSSGNVEYSTMVSEREQYEEFLLKLSEFDVSKLSDSDKASYGEFVETVKKYFNENNLNLSDKEKDQLAKLLWVLNAEKASGELIQDLITHMNIGNMEFADMLISLFNMESYDLESRLYKLFMKSNNFNVDSLTAEDRKVYDTIRASVMKKLPSIYDKEYWENEHGQDLGEVVCAVIYNLLNSETEIDPELLTQVIYYLRLDHPSFLDLAGEYAGTLAKYISREKFWFDYASEIYHMVYDGVMNEKLDEVYDKFLETGDAREYLMGVIDAGGLYTKKDANELVKALYNIVLMREADEQGFKFWVIKFNEIAESGKSVKDIVSYIVDSMIGSDEFKYISQRFDFDI